VARQALLHLEIPVSTIDEFTDATRLEFYRGLETEEEFGE